jgi:hypothetical protein
MGEEAAKPHQAWFKTICYSSLEQTMNGILVHREGQA